MVELFATLGTLTSVRCAGLIDEAVDEAELSAIMAAGPGRAVVTVLAVVTELVPGLEHVVVTGTDSDVARERFDVPPNTSGTRS